MSAAAQGREQLTEAELATKGPTTWPFRLLKYVLNGNSENKCLTADGPGREGVSLQPCDCKNELQYWKFEGDPRGDKVLRNKGTNYCLDSGKFYSWQAGFNTPAKLNTSVCRPGHEQQRMMWRYLNLGGRYVPSGEIKHFSQHPEARRNGENGICLDGTTFWDCKNRETFQWEESCPVAPPAPAPAPPVPAGPTTTTRKITMTGRAALTGGAQCAPDTQETSEFLRYVASCRAAGSDVRLNNFFNQSKALIQNTFEEARAQFDNLMIVGDNQYSMLTLNGNTASGLESQLKQAQQEKKRLIEELKQNQREGDAAEKTFLENIMEHTPTGEPFPSLQDVALYIFTIGWVAMVAVLVLVRTFSPTGSWRGGFFTLSILVAVSFCIYAILYNFA